MVFDKRQSRDRWSAFWGKKHVLNPFYLLMDMLRYFSIYTHLYVGRRLCEGDRILEAGCGYAQASQLLVKRRNGTLVGVDFSLPAIRKAHKMSKRTSIDANFIVADVGSLPLRSGAVSFSWNMGVLEHFSNPKDVINEMVRVTEKDGIVCIIVPTYNNLLVRIRDITHRLTGFFFDFAKYWGGDRAANTITDNSLYLLLIKTGLSSVKRVPLLSELLIEQVVIGRKTES